MDRIICMLRAHTVLAVPWSGPRTGSNKAAPSPVAATCSTDCCPHHHRACVGVACGARVSPPLISRVSDAGENLRRITDGYCYA
ncbi:hypothetical protein B296_00013605 [Ensete ventricosum]|uniref:Uncharacterized protein n=1 Tax=Ensete ventricosum TaxID=4639 RepID=A0A426Y9E2_ENSVE|nr:hypothetical protein B296_00013605 [Ensete ventricosum]